LLLFRIAHECLTWTASAMAAFRLSFR